MRHVKCECGHVNPLGTIFCESCGKTVEEESSPKKLLDMRYEGSARRSKTYKRSLIDKIWSFFSSVSVGVSLIVITLIASAVGTIYPQEIYLPPDGQVNPAKYYEDQYGITGRLYYELGFNNLYGSWWYILLIGLIGISLVICSIDRFVPLYKALKRQGVKRHESFLRRQRLFSETITEFSDSMMDQVKEKLTKKHYHVRIEGQNILAEKGRFSRWGPYVNHIGLIIVLIGAMLRFFPGMYIDQSMWIREGETKEVVGTNGEYFIKNNGFLLDVYTKENTGKVFDDALDIVGDGSLVKTYQTDVTLYKRVGDIIPGAEPKLKKIKDYKIRVNEPLEHDNYSFYQVDYKLNELNKMKFHLVAKEKEEKPLGTMTIDLHNPKKVYDLGNGYSVEILKYYQDFFVNEEGEPASKSKVPNNPAFIFKMNAPDIPNGEKSLVAIQQTIEPSQNNKYEMEFADIETRNVSALNIKRDHTLWIIAFGGLIFMIGLVQGMYWFHRRVWIQYINGKWIVASHTNKNWFGLKQELKYLLKDSPLTIPVDQLDIEKNEK